MDDKQISSLKGIKKKEEFRLDGLQVEEPFNLSELEKELQKYQPLTKAILVTHHESEKNPSKRKQSTTGLQNNAMTSQEIKLAYKSLINELYEKNRAMFQDLGEIRLHEVYDESGLSQRETLPTVITDFSVDKREDIKIIFESKGHFTELMELARLVSTREYVVLRRQSTSFVSTFFNSHPFGHDVSQYLHTYWPNVSLDAYSNSNVGIPSLIIKNSVLVHHIPLQVGTKVSLFIFAKCCVGRIDANPENDSYICASVKVRRYGMFLPLAGRETRCRKCRSGIDRLKFSRNSIKTLSEGNEQEDDDPLGSFGDELYYLYITRFGNKLKVGRTRVSRGVSRLLEQTCFDALVIYPLLSYENADALEEQVRNTIREHLHCLLEFGIEKVYDKGFTTDKIETIKQWYSGSLKSNEQLYRKVVEILLNSEISTMLHLTNRKYVNLSENWVFDAKLDLRNPSEISDPFTEVQGEVKGIAGSLVFLDGEYFLDLKKLDGCLFRGSGFS